MWGEGQGPLPCESRSPRRPEFTRKVQPGCRRKGYSLGCFGSKGVEAIHRTEQLQKKAGVLVEGWEGFWCCKAARVTAC